MTPLHSRGLLAGAAAILCAITWSAGYQPAIRRYHQEVSQIHDISARLAEADTMVSPDGGIPAWLKLNEERLSHLRARLPEQSQLPQLLNLLVEQLKASDLRVLNVTQGNPEPIKDKGGAPLLIDGLPCARLPLTITAEGRYLVFLSVIEKLTSESFPAVVTLQQMDLRRKGDLSAALDMSLNLSLYLVMPKSDG